MKIKISKKQWEDFNKKAQAGLEDVPGKSEKSPTKQIDKPKPITDEDFATKAQLNKLKNDVMDKYNKGEITKDQLKMWLEEFSKRNVQNIKISKRQWQEIGKIAGWIKIAKKKYKVVDNEFNRANYKDIIGKIYDEPPAYAGVEEVEETVEKK